MEFPIIINWTIPVPFLGSLGGILFLFIQISIENSVS